MMEASIRLDILGERWNQGHISWGYPLQNGTLQALRIIGSGSRYTLLDLQCMRQIIKISCHMY